jgi:hypothetical protein
MFKTFLRGVVFGAGWLMGQAAVASVCEVYLQEKTINGFREAMKAQVPRCTCNECSTGTDKQGC